MKSREKADLFEMFSDPRPSGGSKGLGEGFRKFLEERGEYPFKDNVGSGAFKGRKAFRFKAETLLIGSIVFMVVLIAVFSLGVWNGHKGEARADTLSETQVQVQRLPDVAPTVVTDPMPAPVKAAPAVQPAEEPPPAPAPSGAYAIRVVSLGLGQTKEAKEIAAFFETKGLKPAVVRAINRNLVIEVGAFPSTQGAPSQRALREVQALKFKGNRFNSAYFVKSKRE